MPDEKVVEARRQTQHKLELMERYWGARCTILARTAGRFPFCPTRLWLIDTHAGAGEHASATDPDGKIEGTPALAALAARQAQRAFPGVEVRVRATDKSKEVATALLAAMRPYTGAPPDGVDVKVGNVDWVKAAPWVAAEIAPRTTCTAADQSAPVVTITGACGLSIPTSGRRSRVRRTPKRRNGGTRSGSGT